MRKQFLREQREITMIEDRRINNYLNPHMSFFLFSSMKDPIPFSGDESPSPLFSSVFFSNSSKSTFITFLLTESY